MKAATFPPLRVNQELRQAAKKILLDGESLFSFVEQSIRENIQRRQLKSVFIERGLFYREAAQQNNAYLSADTIVSRLEEMQSAAKSTKSAK